MKTPAEVLTDICRRVAANWDSDITKVTSTWPHQFPLGAVSKIDLETNFASFQMQTFEWGDWARAKGLPLVVASRRVAGTLQTIPTHVAVSDLDTAIELLGPEWTRRIQRGRSRATVLKAQFPQLANPGKIVRAVDGYTDTDFTLLCTTAHWFTQHNASGLTPRQVPIAGLHAKWLNTSESLLKTLAGVDDLGLLRRHPQRVHFTYLDPQHLAFGGRKHDSATVGDNFTPAYRPDVVVISENKDTAIHFTSLAKAISVEGSGFGGEAASAFDWITTCPNLIYWGDMDASGLEIVNGYRKAGVPVSTILMDLETYEAYERFGSTTDTSGLALPAVVRRALPWLTEPERELYEHLTDPAWTRVRRVEQERIPLSVASAALTMLIEQESVEVGLSLPTEH